MRWAVGAGLLLVAVPALLFGTILGLVSSGAVNDAMTEPDRQELARLLDLDPRRVQPQLGIKVAASAAHYREYITRAMGLTPTELGSQYWD